MLTQLHPPLPLNTPRGTGLCHFALDYGLEFNLCWVVMLDDSGEIWAFDNDQVRAMKNISYDAPRSSSKIEVPKGVVTIAKKKAKNKKKK